jgi:O-antigen ligase
MQISTNPDKLRIHLAVALLAIAMMLGGGGSPSPLPEMALQCLAVLLAGVWVLAAPPGGRLPIYRDAAWQMAILILALPVLQLVPLPAMIWTALPGRDAAQAALALVGQDTSWRPWSLLPLRTMASLLSMVPPVILLLMAASLQAPGRQRLIITVAGVGFLTLVVGAGQMSSGAANALRFYTDHRSYLLGFQANHNSTADVLLIAMVAATAAAESWFAAQSKRGNPTPLLVTILAMSLLLMLGIILTASRAGMALIPVAMLAQLAILHHRMHCNGRIMGLSSITLVILAGLVWFFLRDNVIIATVLARFDFSGEPRTDIWMDSTFVLRQYWPFGSGMGTFAPVFMASQRLEVLGPLVVNQAHNDFLEFVIEGGLAAIFVMLGFAAMLVRAAVKAIRSVSAAQYPQLIFAIATFTIIGLHSLVDYPLRSMALACMASVATGLLLALGGPNREGPEETLKVEA